MVLVHVCTILRRTWTYYTIIQILCLSYDTPKSRVILQKKPIQTWHFATDCFLHSHHISANSSSLILPFGITYMYLLLIASVSSPECIYQRGHGGDCMLLFCISWEADIESQMLLCHWHDMYAWTSWKNITT